MRLKSAQIQNYRSIKDTGNFDIEYLKTILVGLNESGKTVVLQALQKLSKSDTSGFNPLRDYPRSMYEDIATKKVEPSAITVVIGYFELEKSDLDLLPKEFNECCSFKVWRNLDNSRYCSLENVERKVIYKDIKDDFIELGTFVDACENFNSVKKTIVEYGRITAGWSDFELISYDKTAELRRWLDSIYSYVANDNIRKKFHAVLYEKILYNRRYDKVLKILDNRTPVFIMFKSYFRVKASICFERLAQQIERGNFDEFSDYGNLCLLKYLGFTPKMLSECVEKNTANDFDKIDALDSRRYRLNTASAKLAKEISTIWSPDSRKEVSNLKIRIDGQYLKVVVEDELGVEIELDQRSEGFQWLFSFFVVFFAEAMDKHKNAILLFDEPGMSLHAVKQREFREVLSKLAVKNQLIYTTHSPFLVGSEELDSVRIVELKDRSHGTKVHTIFNSENPVSLLPLQEALGYNLSQCMFAHQKNVVLEGLTDYWYISSTEQLLRKAKGKKGLDKNISLLFANSASKIVYYATILYAQKLKVAVLFDSDTEGDKAADDDGLKCTLGNKKILRVHTFCPSVEKPETEDLLRDTLITIVNENYGEDVRQFEDYNPTCSIVGLLKRGIPNFKKKDLALSYVKWAKIHSASDLSDNEIKNWTNLILEINKVLK